MNELAVLAGNAAESGAAVAMDRFERGLQVKMKSAKMDYVTEADLDAQTAITETIARAYPDHQIVGEEGGARKDVPDSGPSWIIDPIDGTTNFIHGLSTWAAAVAHVQDGERISAAIAVPAVDHQYVADDTVSRDGSRVTVSDRRDTEVFLVAPILRYTGHRANRERFAHLTDGLIHEFGDLRRLGCAQATLAYVADGTLDAAFGPSEPRAWDTVAGTHMVEAAGGTVTDLDGTPWSHRSSGIVASNGHAHGELLAMLEDYDVI